MTRFRPCIDLHQGSVKQIVGGTLTHQADDLKTNHVSEHPAAHYATLYRDKALQGSHVIMLGPGNEAAAREACSAWPHALQVGGGIDASNAKAWIERGAAKVIVTSALFPEKRFSLAKLRGILAALDGDASKLVIDLSCRRVVRDNDDEKQTTWFVAMDKWQTITELEITAETLRVLRPYCAEFLIHAADNEGLQGGIDGELVRRLGEWDVGIPVTYAGGARSLDDLDLVERLSAGKVDLTIGSALDVFGGSGVKFEDCVAWNLDRDRRRNES